MMNKRMPHFLEVFLPNLSSDRMKVPSKFVEHLVDRTSGSLSLIGPSGNVWHVDLLELNGNLYFRDGWPTFVKDHSIQCGDTLVFRYNGNSNFNVQIFDESSCEKDEAFYADCSQGASDCCENLEKKRERDMEGSMLDLVAEKKMRGRWVSTGSGEQFKMFAKKGQKYKKAASGPDNRTKDFATASKKTIVLAIPSLRGPDGWASPVNFNVKKISSKVKKASKKDRMIDFQKIPSISKFIQSRAANYFTSDFPYFVRVMCYSNISGNGTMKIPTHFSKDHLPNCRIKVTLMNLNGDCWMVNSIPTTKRQTTLHSFCGGWLSFVRDNSIKIEDVCIFELVSNFEMRVRVLRPGLEGLECQFGSNSAVDGVGLGGRHLEAAENVAHHTGALPLQEFHQTDEQWSPHGKKDKIKTDAMPYMQQEEVSYIDTVDDFIAVPFPACASASSIGTNCDSTADKHLVCYTGETMSYQAIDNSQVDLQATHSMSMQPIVGEACDTLSFTSPFPSFMKVMMNSNVGGSFTLNVPRKFAAAHLPSYKAEVVLRNLKGESWNVVAARYGNATKFCGGWMSFVRMNDVKVGDICVFELLDERLLQVRVFEGSHKTPVCVYDEAVIDDSTAFVESTECGVLPEA